jgi:hypothetical protein
MEGVVNVGARSVVSVGSGCKGVKINKNTNDLALVWLFERERAIIV